MQKPTADNHPSVADSELAQLTDLRARLADCMEADRTALHRRLQQAASRLRSGQPVERMLASIASQVALGAARRRARQDSVPRPTYPAELPVTAHRAEIIRAIVEHQVLIVSGETGSGKTTQLPKLCLEAGRGVQGWIGHTQPRRIAARSVAQRIATELGNADLVGYQVRHQSRLSNQGLIKVMTDGILLAEIRGDRRLLQYDTLIIDEAHERSLNIDFLLGYLKTLLRERPGLKLLITSATMDTERFRAYFDNAPMIEVGGRGYPVEIRYAPLRDETGDGREQELPEAIARAFFALQKQAPGDTLVFLPGEREIHEAAEYLQQAAPDKYEILRLYARLSEAEQEKIFRGHRGVRVILATNVAETSLTVPGIRYVIDSGLARISRYDHQSKVRRLPIEAISRAAAEQRAGRCGRLGPGICVRLYAEQDFDQREAFTAPEILRTSLAAVVLQMKYLRLGEPEHFPFLNPPARRAIRDAYHSLYELAAIDDQQELTDIGRQLARLPVDPRLGRMLIAAGQLGSLAEVLIICAALAAQDPRERPRDKQQQADQIQARFLDRGSDFITLLNLWNAFQEKKRASSGNQLRRWCAEHYLSWRRMREWTETHRQLRDMAREMHPGAAGQPHPAEQTPRHADLIHRALLTGLLGNLAMKQELAEYRGVRNSALWLFPGSALRKNRPRWIMAAELVETSRLYARTLAGINPGWVESVAGHLLQYRYSEPRWERAKATVIAYEKVTLHGLPIVARRAVEYGLTHPVEARELFIREALVAGNFDSDAAFLAHNRQLLAEVENLEARQRRQDLRIDDDHLYAFFAARLPDQVHNGFKFNHWWRKQQKTAPRLLHLSADVLLLDPAKADRVRQDYPDCLEINGLKLPLAYHFEPGHPADGVTCHIPLGLLNQLPSEPFEWLVSGLLPEKITALLRTLPKPLRRHLVPAPDFAAACLPGLHPGAQPLCTSLAKRLGEISGVELQAEHFHPAELAEHLKMRFAVRDESAIELAAGRDLQRLQMELGEQARAAFSQTINSGQARPIDRDTIDDWDFGDLEPVEIDTPGNTLLRGWPALVASSRGVELRYFDMPEIAASKHQIGFRALLGLVVGKSAPQGPKGPLPGSGLRDLALAYQSFGNQRELQDELQQAALRRTLGDQPAPWTETEFCRQRQLAIDNLPAASAQLHALVGRILSDWRDLRRRLQACDPVGLADTLGDLQEQLDHLLYRGFIARTPPAWLDQIPRYLRGMRIRLERAAFDPSRDRAARQQFRPLWESFQAQATAHLDQLDWVTYRWLLEEMRISLFAQELGTSQPVSLQRLRNRWRELQAEPGKSELRLPPAPKPVVMNFFSREEAP